MSIDPKKAAEIARNAGLSLSDARAIAAMAESDADAEELAAVFAGDEPDPLEKSLAALFPKRTEDEPAESTSGDAGLKSGNDPTGEHDGTDPLEAALRRAGRI